jgi:UDPglucose--hexose-1-phosphate uridylyltransferase
VAIAPGRARRPGALVGQIEEPTAEELETCPFCEGREDRTPPETLALGRPDGTPPDSPGWTVRVVPNLYPALERQEVVVHSPRHVRSFAELTDAEVAGIAEAWARRREAGRASGYLHAMVNEGRIAGASLVHSHSQLAWLPHEPPALVRETGSVADVLHELPVDEDKDVVLAVHPAGRVPYELVIAPFVADDDPFAYRLAPALRLLREAARRLRAVEGAVPWNAWLHQGPHWHVEVVPRLTVLAGLELGAELYVNTVAPEEAARRLREAAG